MENAENVYVDLQKHLDEQAVGFHATKTGLKSVSSKNYSVQNRRT